MSRHGADRERWPALAAGLLPLAAAMTRRDRRWLALTALLAHQTEEWVWPGGFRRRFNRELLASDRDDSPLTPAIGLRVNVLLGWGMSLAAFGGARAAPARAALYANHLGNVALHTAWAARRRGYNPGLVTAYGALLPVAVDGLRALREAGGSPAQRLGAGAGAAAAAAPVPLMRRRARATSDV